MSEHSSTYAAEGGVFVTFEGGEGCGKSTQIALLAERLRGAGARVRTLREPGGTTVGEMVRTLLLDPANDTMGDVTELLLYEASRAQLVREVIRPALSAGEIVLCDRFTDSTLAYQGYGRGLPIDVVAGLNAVATGETRPARTVVLDIEVSNGLDRATSGGADRLEGLEERFHERVRDGFLALAGNEPERVRIVDASGDAHAVAARVLGAVRDLPGLARYVD